MTLAVAVAAGLVAFNIVTNLQTSRDVTYLVRNLVAGAALVGITRLAGLSWDDLGLAPTIVGAGWQLGRFAVVIVAVATALLGALAGRVAAVHRVLADRRGDLPPRRLAFHALVRIPLGTAAFEELAFRGVLLALFADAVSIHWAVAAQAVAFGLWHVGPSRLTARLNGRSDPVAVRREITVAVVATTLGGAGFALLRLGSGSLLAPVMAHAAINVFGLLLAAVLRQASDPGPEGSRN
jgi:membrane protease YdiL (CAAX protease family)